MPQAIPLPLTYSFYALVAWGLSAVFVAFRILAQEDIKAGLAMRAGVLVWMGVPAVMAISGQFLDMRVTPPHLMRVVAIMAVSIVAFVISPLGRKAAERLPLTFIVGVQGFRFPLELLLYALAARGLVAEEMTLAGYNFDIVTGVLAFVLWIALHKKVAPVWSVWAFNVIGMLLLATVVTVAILGFPEPFGLFQPSNLIVAFYPWMWLPTFLVQVALFAHLLVFRKLLLPTPPPRKNV